MAAEREVKLDASEHFALPELGGIGGLRAVERGVLVMESTYWDSDTLQLLHAGLGLRHRTVDGDAGNWTLKGTSTREGELLVREEQHAPGPASQPPAALTDHLPPDVPPSALRPVARLRARRHVVDLLEPEDARWAEIADDSVDVFDGDVVVAGFREVEVEVTGDGDGERMQAILAVLREAGATPARFGSKYLRALMALGRAAPGDGGLH